MSQNEYAKFGISSPEAVANILRLIEETYVLSKDNTPLIKKHLEEYLFLKGHAAPSAIQEKWNELAALLNSFKSKKET